MSRTTFLITELLIPVSAHTVGGEGIYQALYRKWRPKSFDEVVGQEQITETLKTQVRTGHLSHAYIFIGTRGTGKTTCARILAKAVNCENPVNGNPCNRCRFCRGIDEGTILDIVEMDAASNNGVDDVRDLREEAVFSPAMAKKRVYIIDEVHMLSNSAFNALLKIIEEPPEHLMFILATTELQKVPATILSRCQRHSFRRIPADRLAPYLMEIAERENLKLDEAAARQIGRLAEGGVRDALSILDQCSGAGIVTTETVLETMGLAGNRNLAEMLERILNQDSAGALTLFHKIWLDGREPGSFLEELSGLLRDIMIIKAAPKGGEELISGNYEREQLAGFAARMTREEILYCAETVRNSISRAKQMRSPRVEAEMCLVALCGRRNAEGTAALCARISRLEEMLKSGRVSAASINTGQESAYSSGKDTPQAPSDVQVAADLQISNGAQNAVNPPEPAYAQVAAAPSVQMAEKQRSPAQINRQQAEPAKASQTQEAALEAAETGSGTTGECRQETEQAAATDAILRQLHEQLPRELRGMTENRDKFFLRVEGDIVIVETVPGFLMERVKKPEVRQLIADVSEKELQHPVLVQVAERPKPVREKRDINELRKFKEVTFL